MRLFGLRGLLGLLLALFLCRCPADDLGTSCVVGITGSTGITPPRPDYRCDGEVCASSPVRLDYCSRECQSDFNCPSGFTCAMPTGGTTKLCLLEKLCRPGVASDCPRERMICTEVQTDDVDNPKYYCDVKSSESSSSSSMNTSNNTGSTSNTGSTTNSSTCTSLTASITGQYKGTQVSSNGSTHTDQPVSLTQNGTSVTGWDAGTSGAIETLSGTLSGCTLTGTWSQAASGPFSITFTKDGQSFAGRWNYEGGAVTGTNGFSWTGTRTSTTPEPKPSTGASCSSDSACSSGCTGSCYQCLSGSCRCGYRGVSGGCIY